MKYEKPELTQLDSAVHAVRNSMNKGTPLYDSDPSVATSAAYEADE